MYLTLEDLEYLCCDLGFVPNSRGNKAAVNLHPTGLETTTLKSKGWQ